MKHEAPYKKMKVSGNDSKSFRTRKSNGNTSSVKKSRGTSSRGRGSYRDRSNRDRRRDDSPQEDRDEDTSHGDKEKNKTSKFFSPKSFNEAWSSFFSICAILTAETLSNVTSKMSSLDSSLVMCYILGIVYSL